MSERVDGRERFEVCTCLWVLLEEDASERSGFDDGCEIDCTCICSGASRYHLLYYFEVHFVN